MKINLVFCSLCSISSVLYFSVYILVSSLSISVLPDRRRTTTTNAWTRSFLVLIQAARRTQNFYTWIKINCISRRWTLASVTLLTIPIHRVVVKWKKERVLKKVNKLISFPLNNFVWFFLSTFTQSNSIRVLCLCVVYPTRCVHNLQFPIKCEKLIRIFFLFTISSCASIERNIYTDKHSSSPSHHRASGGSENQASSSSSGHERRHKSSSVNNCYLSSSSNGQHQSQYHQQKPLSISANNFSPASNLSDSNKVYKSSSHNVTTGGTCDKNYQQPTQQQYNSSRNGNNSAAYLSQSHFDFEHMLGDPNDPNNPNNQNLGKQSYNTTASGSSRSSRSYNPQTNQPVNSDQFQGSCFIVTLNINPDPCKQKEKYSQQLLVIWNFPLLSFSSDREIFLLHT